MITIDQTLCRRCGACITVCPVGMFRREEDGSVSAREKPCLDCYHCTAVCPAKAVGCTELTPEQCYPDPAQGDGLLPRLQRRRSIRHFTDQTPDRALIQQALDGTAYAPSSKNQRACRWTVLLGREKVEQARRAVLEWAPGIPEMRHLAAADRRGRDPITCGAPCLIFAHCDHDAVNPSTDPVIAATLAEQLLNEQGLGTCWGGYLCRAAAACPGLRELLDLPQGHRVHAVLMTGYAAEHYPNIPYRPAAGVRWLE